MLFVVTGASGFIGATLVSLLLREGHEVRALVRETSDVSRLSAEADIRSGSMDDPDFLDKAVEGADVVVHLAGVTRARNEAGYLYGNVALTREICRAVLRNGDDPAYVQVSSLAAAGPCSAPPGLVGDEPPAPVSLYGKSKLGGERTVKELLTGYRYAIVRPPMVYGPGDVDFLPFFKLAAKGFGTAAGGLQVPYSLVYSEDLAAGIVAAASGLAEKRVKPGSVYHFTDGHPTTFQEMTWTAAGLQGRKATVLSIPLGVVQFITGINGLLMKLGMKPPYLNPDKYLEAAQSGWLCSDDKARAELGYESQYDQKSGMAKTLEWYKKSGMT